MLYGKILAKFRGIICLKFINYTLTVAYAEMNYLIANKY